MTPPLEAIRAVESWTTQMADAGNKPKLVMDNSTGQLVVRVNGCTVWPLDAPRRLQEGIQ